MWPGDRDAQLTFAQLPREEASPWVTELLALPRIDVGTLRALRSVEVSPDLGGEVADGEPPNNDESLEITGCAPSIMRKKVDPLTCLFFSKRGDLAVRLIEPPVPEEIQTPEVPSGMLHAVRLLGLSDQIRVFKRIAGDGLPVYQEV